VTEHNSTKDTNEFLLWEYDSANKLTLHIDEVRGRLTNFYFAFGSSAGAGLLFLLSGKIEKIFFVTPVNVVTSLIIFVGLVGFVAVGIIARLRRVQIEHFRIVNNIRSYFIEERIELWNVVELSSQTLPKPSFKSGSYLWTLVIVLVSSFFFAFGIFMLVHKACGASLANGVIVATTTGLLSVLFEHWVYFRWATPPPPPNYESCRVPAGSNQKIKRTHDS